MLPTLSCHARAGGTTLGPTTCVPKAPLRGTQQPLAAPEWGQRCHWVCHQLDPEPALGAQGHPACAPTVRKAQGESVSTAPSPSQGDISTLVCHWEHLLLPLPQGGVSRLCCSMGAARDGGSSARALSGGAASPRGPGEGCRAQVGGARGHRLRPMDTAPSSPRHIQNISTAPKEAAGALHIPAERVREHRCPQIQPYL